MPLFILLGVFLLPTLTTPIERDRLYIWNIGQGSWSTLITANRCYHFDMGGELFVRHSALQHCRDKKNLLFLSHLDADHISLIPKALRFFRSLCLVGDTRAYDIPLSFTKSARRKAKLEKSKAKKLAIINPLPSCQLQSLSFFGHELKRVRNIMFRASDGILKTTNDYSRIFTLDNRWLFTGDSPKKAEMIWAPRLRSGVRKYSIEYLMVGHHGSRTSTSDFLLSHVPHLKMAIVSARQYKYGHPHAEVVARFAQYKIPLLLTETWGSLIFEL